MKPVRGRITLDGKSTQTAVLEAQAFSALNEDRIKILEALGSEAKYPAQVAKELGLYAQTAYYHFHILTRAGLIEPSGFVEKSGGVAKTFRAVAPSLSVLLDPSSLRTVGSSREKPPAMLAPFFEGASLDAKFVVGSPDPHGKFRAQGSEYCAMEVAGYFGRYAAFDYPLYYLDTEVRDPVKRHHLVLFGGPKVNTLVAEANPKLPVRFSEPSLELRSTVSGKAYGEVANVGVVEVVDSPFCKGKKLMLVAGTHYLGTRVAALALIRHADKIEEGNSHDRSVCARVVQGFDEDGDGIVDAVDFLE